MLTHRRWPPTTTSSTGSSRRWSGRTTWCCCVPLFHAYGLNTGLGAIAAHARPRCAGRPLRPGATPRPDRAARRHRRGRRTADVRGLVTRGRPAADGAGRGCGRRCAARRRSDPADAARFTAATGKTVIDRVRPDRDRAGAHHQRGQRPTPKTGSIGRPLPGVELLLRAADGEVLWHDGTASPADDLADWTTTSADSAGTDPGEIVVRGANLFAGTGRTGAAGRTPDGWWATGDVAYADGDGDLFLVDRIGELILVNGFNVYPAEIERVLDAHPGVAEAAVVGVPDPADRPAVAGVRRARARPRRPTAAELQAYCARNLARFKLPDRDRARAELPHSATGKVRKRACCGPAMTPADADQPARLPPVRGGQGGAGPDRRRAGGRVDVDVDSIELQRDYGDRVPVMLLDGKEHGYWRVEEDRLRRDLARHAGGPAPVRLAARGSHSPRLGLERHPARRPRPWWSRRPTRRSPRSAGAASTPTSTGGLPPAGRRVLRRGARAGGGRRGVRPAGPDLPRRVPAGLTTTDAGRRRDGRDPVLAGHPVAAVHVVPRRAGPGGRDVRADRPVRPGRRPADRGRRRAARPATWRGTWPSSGSTGDRVLIGDSLDDAAAAASVGAAVVLYTGGFTDPAGCAPPGCRWRTPWSRRSSWPEL